MAIVAAVASAQYYYGGYAAYPAYSYGYAYPSYGYAAYPGGYYLKKWAGRGLLEPLEASN